MFDDKRKSILLVSGLCICALALSGCGSGPDEGDASPRQEPTAPRAAPASTTPAAAAPVEPRGWQTVTEGGWSFDIPQDWVDSPFMYYPEEFAERTWPAVRCEIGSRVIQADQTAEEVLEDMFGPPPWTMTPVTVCNEDGHLVEASSAGRTVLALVFEYEASTSYGPMPAVNLFFCSAATARYPQYAAVFRRILESTRCEDR